MTRLSSGFILFIVSLAVLSCSGTKNSARWVSIKMDRTPCYGTCPIYSFKLDVDGSAQFEGTRFTEKLGFWSKEFSESELEPLQEFMKRFDPEVYDLVYPTNYSDLPGIVLEFNSANYMRRIEIFGEHPSELDTIVAHLTRLADSPGWQNRNTE